VTALSTESLQNKQVRDVVDLGETVPALRIVSATNSTTSTTITIRGLAQGNPDPTFSPKVGLYVDVV
jgi:outer membrane receptor for ferrienterochelin and colicin